MADEAGGKGARPGLFAALKELLVKLLTIGRTRLSLLAIELEEEKFRVVDLLISALAAVFLLSFAVVLVVVFLVVVFWEQRVAVLGCSLVAVVLPGLYFVFRLRAAAARPVALFRDSLQELDKDVAALKSSAAEPQ